MDSHYIDNAKVFKAFCDENRLQILELLQTGEKCACVLLEYLKISQPTLSHHMKILCESGVVAGRKQGKWTYYAISSEGVAAAKELLHKLTLAMESDETVSACICDETYAKCLDIDFLYLDLNTCKRCVTTGDALDEALDALAPVLQTMNYSVNVNRVNITTSELAEQYRFVSSPTIRVNGAELCAELKESDCMDCGDLCGGSMDCRVFVFDGDDYEQPPSAMIADGILRAIYQASPQTEEKPYRLPDNLKRFFDGTQTTCCSGNCDCKIADQTEVR